jgi:hypothetical protein
VLAAPVAVEQKATEKTEFLGALCSLPVLLFALARKAARGVEIRCRSWFLARGLTILTRNVVGF